MHAVKCKCTLASGFQPVFSIFFMKPQNADEFSPSNPSRAPANERSLQGNEAVANATVHSAWTASAASVNSGTENITTNGMAVNLAAVTNGNGFTVTTTGSGTTRQRQLLPPTQRGDEGERGSEKVVG